MSRKTVLIVDDDPSCTRFFMSKMHEETDLIGIAIEDLRKAVSLIEDARIGLDAILADLYFEPVTNGSATDAEDGLDLLRIAYQRRPGIKLYAMSFFDNDKLYRSKASELKLPISKWFPKLVFTGHKEQSPWKIIARDLCVPSTATSSTRNDELILIDFDVFLAHNSKDKAEVERIARDLEKQGIRPWLDKWHIPPGRTFQDSITIALERTRSAAVFVGKNGLGPWQDLEQKAAITQFVARRAPVIPVFLHQSIEGIGLPLFLREFSAVFFSDELPYAESLASLVWGIKGRRD